jgi:hypothetical protein
MLDSVDTGQWKHFSQTFTIAKKRNIFQKLLDKVVGTRYSVDTVEVNFLYLGDVEPEVILSGLYISRIEPGEKKVVDF